MTLHTLNKQSADLLRLCISSLMAEDSLLLYEDGVYAALDNPVHSKQLARLPSGIKLYVLLEDLEARGIMEKVPEAFSRISYRDFVSLCLASSKVVNWN